MFVNSRGRVYRILESKKKLKVGAEAGKPTSSSGEIPSEDVSENIECLTNAMCMYV